ncbi:MurR/RpiR family transcriptional regulator [Carnobacterium gallinarum]
MATIYQIINQHYEKLSEAEQGVIDYILAFSDIQKLKLKDISDELYVSNTTVIRACKKLGYTTFNDLKYAFLKEIETANPTEKKQSDFQEIVGNVKSEMLRTLDMADEKKINQVCELLIGTRRIFCVGVGSSSEVASEFNRKLKLIDFWSNEYSDKFSIERIARIVSKGDILLVFSLNGNDEEVNEVVIKAKNSQAHIISVTTMNPNALSRLSTISLQVYNNPVHRKKLRSRLMLYTVSNLIFEQLLTKIPSVE